MEFDVREGFENKITTIRFSAERGHKMSYTYVAQRLEKYRTDGTVKIMDDDAFVVIESVAHASNLIKALEKAIELGWLTD